MAKSQNQKAKILFLAQMMYETGENRTITMQDILANLLERGIRAERKSIYDDFVALRDFGMDVKFKRGRPGGYYLAGTATAMDFLEAVRVPQMDESEAAAELETPADEELEAAAEGTKEAEAAVQDEGSEHEWAVPNIENAKDKKPMKLLCSKSKEVEVKAYFGNKADYKEKNSGYFTVSVPQISDTKFYGWLTAMGKEVHIMKPKKAAAAYRDYIKTLAKEYKGI